MGASRPDASIPARARLAGRQARAHRGDGISGEAVEESVLFFYASPGFLDETMTIYLARDLTLGKAQPEADESIECHLVPLSQAIDMIFSGQNP